MADPDEQALIVNLRKQLADEKRKSAMLEQKLQFRASRTASVLLEGHDLCEESTDDGVMEAVKDVLANLAALGRAKGLVKSQPTETLSVMQATEEIPEDAKLLGRSLGASVRKGQLSNKRAEAAAKWVDKEIRKMIALIKKHGMCTGGKHSIKFGVLFDVAANEMEAVSGTLKTAKKHKIVAYEAELLMQGASNDVRIDLLKDDIPDSTADTYTYRQVRACSARKGPPKGKSFGAGTLQGTNSKCFFCSKTVYAMEFIGVSGKAMHKSCFRCTTCKSILRQDNYATQDDVFYCKTHYEEAFNKAGGYNFGGGGGDDPIAEESADTGDLQFLLDSEAEPEFLPVANLLRKISLRKDDASTSPTVASAATDQEPEGSDDDDDDEEEEEDDSATSAPASDPQPAESAAPPAPAAVATTEMNVIESGKVLTSTSDTDASAVSPADALKNATAALSAKTTEPATATIAQQVQDANAEPVFKEKKPKKYDNRRLGVSVRKGDIDQASALATVRWVDGEVRKLVNAIKKHGTQNDSGKYEITYGKLAKELTDEFESLTGTLRTCKKQKVIAYNTPFLMRGVHENIVITVLKEEIGEADLDTYTLKQIRQVSGRRFKSGPKAGAPSATAQSLAAELTPSAAAPTPATAGKNSGKETSENTASKSPPRGTSAASETLSPAKGKGRRWLPFMRSKKPKMGRGVAIDAVSTTTAEGAGAGGAAATAVETTPEYERESVEDVMATLVTMEATGDTDDEESSTDESGATKKPIVSMPASKPSVAAAKPDTSSSAPSDGQKDASDDSSDEVSAVRNAALKIKDDSASLGRSLGASVRRGELRAERALAAARWIDKEIRKMIALIKKHGMCTGGKHSIKFGVLFDVAANEMEAVSGTLKTAKKHKIVAYEAELLMQGASNDVRIDLLKDDIPDSTADTYTYRQVRACSGRKFPKKGKAFGAGTLQGTNSKCFFCDKTVYAMEFIGISGKAMHKNCFRCTVCKSTLRQDNYCAQDDVFYCKPHYEEAFRKAGGYEFGSKA